jgi:multimeric flavodoxin WrbA
MKTIILNGNPKPDNTAFDDYLRDLTREMESRGHPIAVFTLREMDIKYCIGCFGCWVKTPGECFVKDDSFIICKEYINSDLVLFASPVIMGFTSALLKKVHDKFIPLIHPYFELVDREVHHLARYSKYPLMALLLEKGKEVDQDDIDIITDIYKRDAINLKTSFSFVRLTSESIEEVADEIDHI